MVDKLSIVLIPQIPFTLGTFNHDTYQAMQRHEYYTLVVVSQHTCIRQMLMDM
jgi:hypothetical protein